MLLHYAAEEFIDKDKAYESVCNISPFFFFVNHLWTSEGMMIQQILIPSSSHIAQEAFGIRF